MLPPRLGISGLVPAAVIGVAHGSSPLLHHEPLALLIVQIELGNSRGLGCLCVGRLDIAEVLAAGAENEGLNAVVDGKRR